MLWGMEEQPCSIDWALLRAVMLCLFSPVSSLGGVRQNILCVSRIIYLLHFVEKAHRVLAMRLGPIC
jgi:hypothetical protein